MLAAAGVTLKLHRFELGVALLAAIAAAAIGASIVLRIDALGMTPECLDRARASQDGVGVGEGCLDLKRQGSTIFGESFLDGEGTVPLSIMGALPFLVGLLGGVPIVARELEARTAQTAWSLNPSRVAWLARQAVPVGAVLGLTITLAAVIATLVGERWVTWGHGNESSIIGLQGPLAVVRAFGAFGLALAAGAILGRSLPAFVVAAAVTLALLAGLGNARDAWMASIPPVVIADISAETGEYVVQPGAVTTGWGVRAPDGVFLAMEVARDIADAAGVPPPQAGDEQDLPALEWFEANGYLLLPVGIGDEQALGWAPYDGLAFGLLGLLGLAGAGISVVRRRPT